MHLWGKRKEELRSPRRGVARAAAESASQEELVREAIQFLRERCNADRIGVWLEPQSQSENEDERPVSFRGAIWDKDVEATPPEWMRMSPEFPLPQELLSGKTVEQELGGAGKGAVLGPLIGMHRALWAPIARGGRLRGVLLAATRAKQTALPKILFESVAAELLLAIELEEEQRMARQLRADMNRRVVGSEPQSSRSRTEVARIVALPLEAGGEVLGVLVAGMRSGSASLATLERLELRASLAAAVSLLHN
jgi:hypothetical protein